jgi:hypothetical protein
MDEDAQIGSDGVVVGEVPGDDSEDGPTMETTRLIKMSPLVRSRHWWISYVAYRDKRNNRPGTAEAGEPAEYRGANELASMADVEESADGVDVFVELEVWDDDGGERLNTIYDW